ncbi:hypothetical protein ACP93_14210 [Xanthomonas sp. NCPPB 1128]|uniref:hypothetical protein n=1 Tax=Xanthomonas sp. NCPPB 1128 TaxID=1775876 RepID=UPI00065AA40D|nr:hypothetical protein [Xanthomonas sp. NCPPB 1128]KMM74950.1 hypothetical protein ACP93_14210 [Xanthomonas sp. NCPPB 1128]
MSYLPLVLFAAVMASDWLLTRRIRNALDSERLKLAGFERFRSGGSPLGIALNLLHLWKIPTSNDSSDPEYLAIRLHCRVHQALVGLLAISIIALVLRGAAP